MLRQTILVILERYLNELKINYRISSKINIDGRKYRMPEIDDRSSNNRIVGNDKSSLLFYRYKYTCYI